MKVFGFFAKFLASALLLCAGFSPAFAQVNRSADVKANRAFIYHGKIVRPDGSVPTGSIPISLKIYSPDPALCLLWAETQTADVKDGGFSVELGHGVNRLPGASGGAAQDFKQAFVNNPGLTIPSAQCASGSSYTPGTADDRLLSAAFTDNGSVIEIAGLPIKSVPFALQAEEIGGYGLANLAKISGAGSAVVYTPAEVTTLKDLLGGDVFFNMKSRAVKNVLNPTDPQDAATKSWVESHVASSMSGGGLGTVVNVSAAGAPLSVLNGTSTPQISIAQANTTTAGYLSAADWNTFNGKQPAGFYLNAAVTTDFVYVGTGVGSTARYLRIGDIHANSGGNPSFLGAAGACSAGTSLQYNSVTDRLECTAYALATNAVATATITDKAVTLAKLQDIATGSLLGRSTAGTGIPEVITVGSGLSLSGGTLTTTGSSGITTVGTITSGTWNGSTIPVAYGGTGTTTGSITAPAGNGLTFSAGSGGNYDVRLTPSGTGATILDGNVGIGTTSPTAKLESKYDSSVTSGFDLPAGLFQTNANPSTASSASYTGLQGMAYSVSDSNLSGSWLTGVQGTARHNVNGTLGLSYGVLANTQNLSTGAITNAYGVRGSISNVSTGTITNGYGLYTSNPGNSGGGTIGTYYGVYVQTPTSASTNYAIYSQGGTNYFGGNVGIGSSTPSSKLEVKTSSSNQRALTLTSFTGAVQQDELVTGIDFVSEDSQLPSKTSSARIDALAARNHVSGTSSAHLVFSTADDISTNVSEKMRITHMGRVGIGTTSPVSKLEVAGTITATGFSGPMTSSVVGVGAGSSGSPSMAFSGDPNTGFYNTSSNDTISVAAGGTKIFDLSASGIVSPTAGGAAITTANGTATSPTYGFAGDAGTGWFRPAASMMAASTGSAERMRIDNNGNVGVGTTSPSLPLHVYKAGNNDTAVFESGGNAGIIVRRSAATATDLRMEAKSGHGVISTSVGHLAFEAGASEHLRILNSGYVGIGTSSPSHKLHIYDSGSNGFLLDAAVVPTMRFAVAGTNKWGLLTNHSGTDDFGIYDYGASAYRMVIQDSTGSVGIGTASPASMLHVREASNGKIVIETAQNGSAASPKYSDLEFRGYNNSIHGLIRVLDESANYIRGQMAFYTQDNAGSATEKMRITDTGNVGIGTTSPSGKLEVLAGTNQRVTIAPVTGYTSPADISTGGVALGLSRPSDGVIASGLFTYDAGANNNLAISARGDMVFLAGFSGLPLNTERMRINSAGNVGIGTTSPSTVLHVRSSVNSSVSARVENVNTGTSAQAAVGLINDAGSTAAFGLTSSNWGGAGYAVGAYINTSAPDGIALAANNATGTVRFVSGGTSERMRIDAAGDVGIGTSNPSYKLHVVGTAGLSTGTAWTNASDARLKNILGDYEYGLDEVLKLHTVRYRYKKDNALDLPSDFEKTGFIAQEVQKVIPDAVKERADGYLELNVDPIHWAVVNAIKDFYARWFADRAEVHRKFEQKDAEVRAIRRENEALSQENAMIKAYLCAKDPAAPFCRAPASIERFDP